MKNVLRAIACRLMCLALMAGIVAFPARAQDHGARISDHHAVTADLALAGLRLFAAPTRSVSPAFTDAEAIPGCRGQVPTEKAMTPDRMPEIPADKLTEAQKKAAEEFAAGRGTAVFGPFVPLLRSPEVMLRAKSMGDYLRYKSTLPPKVSEYAILITARHYSQEYEWSVHYPIAVKAGVNPDLLSALADGRRVKGVYETDQLIYEFVSELLENKCVCDTTYHWAVSKIGEQGVIDLVGLVGYYSMLALVLNTSRTPLPKGEKPALALFPR